MSLAVSDIKSAALSDDMYSAPSVAGGDYTPTSSNIGRRGPSLAGAGSALGSNSSAANEDGELPPPYSLPDEFRAAVGPKPGPKLNVVILAVGSLDDVQQLASVGVLLRNDYGHRLRVATHPEYKGLTQGCGLEYFSLGEADESFFGKHASNQSIESNGSGGSKNSAKEAGWRVSLPDVLNRSWRACTEPGENDKPFIADAIIANPQSFAHVHCAEKLGIPVHILSRQPWAATKAFPHPLAAVPHTDADVGISNLTSYAAVEVMVWRETGEAINKFRKTTLSLETMNLMFAPGLLQRIGVPATYFSSETLRERPSDWPENVTLARGLEDGAKLVHERITTMCRPCSITSGAIASLQAKKTPGLPLSPAAATLLINAGQLKMADLEPFQSQTWDVIRVPTDPVTGLASATHDTLLEIALGLAAGPREVYKQMKKADGDGGSAGGIANGVEAVAVSATKGIGSIVGAGLKSPVVITDGLARGFHNAPRLYGDTTLREEQKVTGFVSGLSAAGKGLGQGVFDGVTGFFTQPVDGARKEGPKGFLKGFGKGVGGLVFKPAAGGVGVASHTAMGVYRELQKIGKPDLEAKIVAGRLARGEEDYAVLSEAERDAAVEKYRQMSVKKA
ncbi:UDP-Glycosyltransferase/glycogen phosphorylase [Thozetella sp. PMI_491]|nr:UDP-Glycosyltransferase/glycogen phosphorylase [Thozetella sp. PMI_491]